MAELLTELRAYLVAEGVVRDPRVAGGAPPLWLQPRHGTPAPGEGTNATETGADAVLGAFVVDQVPAGPGLGYSRRDIVELRLRVRQAPTARAIAAQLFDRLATSPFGIRTDWQMAAIRVIESRQWTGLQPVPTDEPEQGFTFRVAYLLETYSS
jgi:hypothetical protein